MLFEEIVCPSCQSIVKHGLSGEGKEGFVRSADKEWMQKKKSLAIKAF